MFYGIIYLFIIISTKMVDKKNKKQPWRPPTIKSLELRSTLVGKGKTNNIEAYDQNGNDHPSGLGS